jgi:hypothetical protein
MQTTSLHRPTASWSLESKAATNGEPWSLEGLGFGVAEDPFHGLEEYGGAGGQRSTGRHGVEPVSRKRIGQRRSKIFPPLPNG